LVTGWLKPNRIIIVVCPRMVMAENKDDYYRQQAQEAEHWAERAILPRDRAEWLRIAQKWLSLLRRKPPTSAAEAFDDAASALGTHQNISGREQ
jgi:hypothetical protein